MSEELSTTHCSNEVESLKSTNNKLPWSLDRFTHPETVMVFPMEFLLISLR